MPSFVGRCGEDLTTQEPRCSIASCYRFVTETLMRHVLFVLAALILNAPQSATAYTCTLSPSKDAVIVKTGNPDAKPKSCTVTCSFAVPGGVERITCTQTIPGGAK